MQHDRDHDFDSLECALNPFHLVTVGAKFWFIDHGDLQSGLRDPETVAMHRDNVPHALTRHDLHASMGMDDHPFAHMFPTVEKVRPPLDLLFGPQPCTGLRRRKLLQEIVERGTESTTTVFELHARTWGDHGELFELPSGWRFQDNMIQGAAGEPCDNLFVVITYDADNLPNPWEWQLHEATSSDSDALWEEVPTSPDKPRAGWAPTLLAAMTRARTAGSLHLDDRRAAAGGA